MRAHAMLLAVLGVALAVTGCPKAPPAPAPTPPPAPMPPSVVDAATCKRVTHLDVFKSERKLTGTCVGGGRIEYPIALSRERGPKRRQGDQRMPEGEYQIAGPARTSRFHLFIPFDYPSSADAKLALAEGRIDESTYAAVVAAQKRGRMPPQETSLGGALGIHGEGVRWRGDLDLNWTEGCVAVTDKAIEEIARLVRPGTPLRIHP